MGRGAGRAGIASLALLAGAAALSGCGEIASVSGPDDGSPGEAAASSAEDAPRKRGEGRGAGASRGRRARLEQQREEAWERFLMLLDEGRPLEALELLAWLRERAPELLEDPEHAKKIAALHAALVAAVGAADDPEALLASLKPRITDPATVAAMEEAAQRVVAATRAEREALARHVERFHVSAAERRRSNWVDGKLDELAKTPRELLKQAEPLPVPDPEETEKRRGRQLEKLTERKVVTLLDHIHGGLAWLALHQGDDGGFSDRRAQERCKALGHGKPCIAKKAREYPLATTALSVLAFLDFRDQDAKRLFEPHLANGVQWLLAQQRKNGSFEGRYSYSAPIAVMALGQAASSSGSDDVKDAARKALDYLFSVRGADGGFRYRPKSPGDLSVTGWAGQALEAVEDAGIEPPRGMREDLLAFHDACVVAGEGVGYAYTANGRPRRSLVPAGMLLRLVCDPELDGPTRTDWKAYLAEPPRKGSGSDRLYHHYYAVRVLLALDGNLTDPWRERLMEMAGEQETEGDPAGMWRPNKRTHWFSRGGTVLTTAVHALTLEHALYRR
jgi:hypothetical protein